MFNPDFEYTDKLIYNIAKISEYSGMLKEKRFSNTVMMRLEKDARALSSYSSTTIEGNPLPLTVVKRILKNNPINIRDSEREVLNYNSALSKLGEIVKKTKDISLSSDLICTVQGTVLDKLAGEHAIGKYRKQPVFVNNPLSGDVVYLPPDHSDVEKLMKELINYINLNEREINFLILAGIFHKQFVIIHPFLDGNGRTTRLITKLLLAKLGLNTFQLFSFENYYNQNISRYFSYVGEYGNYYEILNSIDFTSWLEYFTDGILDELLRVTKILNRSTSLQERLENHHLRLLRLFEEKGVLKDSNYAKISKRSKASRVSDFQRLIDLGLIERRGKGRSTHYVLI